MLATALTLCLLTFVSDITPGPNFWKIVHYSVFHSRRSAFVFICGLSASSAVHCLLGFAGVSALISRFAHGLLVIQLLGGGYIAWYGFRLMRSRKPAPADTDGTSINSAGTSGRAHAGCAPAFRGGRLLWLDGLFTNFSNPKTILFYASLFAVSLTPDKPAAHVAFIVICLLLTSFLTNLTVASLFAINPVQRVFRRWQAAINRVIGGLLIVAGIKIALQSRS